MLFCLLYLANSYSKNHFLPWLPATSPTRLPWTPRAPQRDLLATSAPCEDIATEPQLAWFAGKTKSWKADLPGGAPPGVGRTHIFQSPDHGRSAVSSLSLPQGPSLLSQPEGPSLCLWVTGSFSTFIQVSVQTSSPPSCPPASHYHTDLNFLHEVILMRK